MNAYSDEFRLLWVVMLNGGVFASAYRFARHRGAGGALQAICDAFLLYFLTQYAAVALPGIFGLFNALTMTGVAALAGAAMWLFSGMGGAMSSLQKKETGGPSAPHPALIACALFTAGYLTADAYSLRLIPPFATDPLVYHLPTAVQWIQTHRLGIYPTWYWNPAASYSPGTGSIFMAWWMAPAGNDVFVRYVQLPPLMFIFFLVARMCRVTGCDRAVAGLIALAATLSRPLLSEAIIPKDDLYVTSFVAAGIVSLAAPGFSPLPVRRGRVGINPWRVGVAIGFVLAGKYTVLLVCPIFLFLIDAPFRARWRIKQWAIAIGIALAMAAPWYIRNIVVTGNPLYPVDLHLPGITIPGLFGTEHDAQLRSGSGIWHMLADTYHSLPTPLIWALIIGWVGACIVGGGKLLRDPLARTCVVGSAATLIIFLVTSPHHEVRYVFPLIVLWFVAIGFALATVRWPAGVYPALAVAIISIGTTFSWELRDKIAEFAGIALFVAAVGVVLVVLHKHISPATDSKRLRRSLRYSEEPGHRAKNRALRSTSETGVYSNGRDLTPSMVYSGAALFLALAAYVEWHAYVASYEESRMIAWSDPGLGYPNQAPIWKWVDENVPADASLAYANTFFVYPYYGFNFTRRVGYAPIRKGLHHFEHFPRMGERVPGDLLVRRMTQVMNEAPDQDTWLENLRAMHAQYLVVMKHDPDNTDLSADPPELDLARSEPKVFVSRFDDPTGQVFQIIMMK